MMWNADNMRLMLPRVNEVLDIVDELTLQEQLGLSRKKVEKLRGVWQKLSESEI
jgi:hypothetical protein